MSRGRILLIKTSSLGDVIHALPAVTDAVAEGYTFDWVVEESFADIPRLHPGVDRVIPMAWREWRRSLFASRPQMAEFRRALRASEYDAVLDSQGLIKSAAVAMMARGPRAGFSHTSAREPWSAFAYQMRARVGKGGHAIDRQRALFAQVLNYQPAPHWRSGIEIEPRSDGPVFLLHGTTWTTKYWPEAMWVDLIEKLRQGDREPLVTWGTDEERQRAQRLVSAGATMIERRPLTELVEVLANSSLVVTVDSGLGHLASAMGIPTIGLYGATSGVLTGCKGQRATTLQGDTPCAPCVRKSCTRYDGPDLMWGGQKVEPPCFAAVTPERVLQVATEVGG